MVYCLVQLVSMIKGRKLVTDNRDHRGKVGDEKDNRGETLCNGLLVEQDRFEGPGMHTVGKQHRGYQRSR